MSERPKHHSVSSTQTYLRCPQQYEFKIISKVQTREQGAPNQNSSLAYGRAVHAALEAAYAQHRHCGTASHETMEDHETAARAALESAWAEEGLSTHNGDLFAAIERLQAVLAALAAPAPADVLGVEEQILLITDSGATLKGFIDLALREGDSVVLRDWKITSTMLGPEALAADYQLNLYGYAARRKWPWAKRIYLEHYYPTKKTSVRVVANSDHEGDALATFEATVELIEDDVDFEPRPGDRCGDCEFQKICPAWTTPVGLEAQEAMKGF